MNILIKPVITEKMTREGEDNNRFGFVVPKSVNKIQIKEAVEKMYNVTVTSVNTMVVPGVEKSKYTKKGLVTGRTGAYKKAVVTLASGETIDFYSGV
jgi:large subunit ribosomal protein L23